MNYRAFYIQRTGKEIPADFEVHHIDGNRMNNDINNLVAIPDGLHARYHLSEYLEPVLLKLPDSFYNPGAGYNSMAVKRLNDFHNSILEVNKWILFRDSLLGHIWIEKKEYK